MSIINLTPSPTETAIYLKNAGQYYCVLSHEGQELTITLSREVGRDQQVDYSINIVHQASRTHVKTVMKSVVTAGGFIKLQGKIVIKPNAGGCSSFLEQRVLLLDPTARAEAIPELEIQNNDVRCSHAASITGLDQIQLHYLMSRGYSSAAAKKTLAAAFLVN